MTAASRWQRCGPAGATYPSRCACRSPSSPSRWRPGCGWPPGSATGERRADFASRLAMLEASELRLGDALERARRNLAHCRPRRAPRTRWCSLSTGTKSVLAHLGDGDASCAASWTSWSRSCAARQATWLLQWAVFESSFVLAAADDWDGARSAGRRGGRAEPAERLLGVRRLLPRQRRAGSDRLAGDLTGALALGRSAVRSRPRRTDHPWWYAAASGLLAGTLLEAGLPDEAATVARRGLEVTGARLAPSLAAALPGPARGRDRRRRCPRARRPALLEAIDAARRAGAWVIGLGLPTCSPRGPGSTTRPRRAPPAARAAASSRDPGELGRAAQPRRGRAGSDQLGDQLSRALRRRRSAPRRTPWAWRSSSTSASAMRRGSASR